jgi:hypothetical protein
MMPSSFKLEFTLAVPLQPLFQKLGETKMIGTLKAELVQPEQTRMLFINPSTWAKRGQNILVLLRNDGNNHTIGIVNSSCISGLQIFDGGQNQKNCELVRDHIFALAKTITTN